MHKDREAINCTVTDTFSIKCEEPAIQVNETVLILGESSSSCFKSVTAGIKYIIAGNFIEREHCGDKLYLASRYTNNNKCTSRSIIAKSDVHKDKMKVAVKRSCSKIKNL